MPTVIQEKIRKILSSKKGFTYLLLILIIAGTIKTAVYTVDATEQSVVTRFGKYIKTVSPGLHIKLPFGIDRAHNIPVEVAQTEQFGFSTLRAGRNNEYKNNIMSEQTMLTGDLNIVNVEWIIQYRIADPKAWLFNVQEKKQTIRDISRSVINTLVGDRAILDIMSAERTNIEHQSKDMMNENFDRLSLGIKVIAVKLQNIVPPEGVQDAFEDVNKAIQDMNRFINEGKEAYNTEIPRAKGEADQQLQIAQGYASERVNRAHGDVARFNAVYDEYRRSPRTTRERLYLETMNELFSSPTKPVLIDGKLENLVPIKQLNPKN